MRPKKTNKLLQYSSLFLSGVLYALAIKYFIIPSRVVLTGTEGIAISLSYFFDNEKLFLAFYAVFQVPLLIFGLTKVSRNFTFNSLIVVVTFFTFLSFLPEFKIANPEPHNERIILVIFGGLLAGVAKAIAFRSRGSTGDEDFLGAYFAMKYLKPVGFVAIIAAIVSTSFGATLEFIKTGELGVVINTVMYTCIYIFISAETLNNFYLKFRLSIINIVTKNFEEVSLAIKRSSPHRTFTVHEGLGGNSAEKFKVIRLVVSQEELQGVVKSIEEHDETAFFYFHDIEGISSSYYIEPIG